MMKFYWSMTLIALSMFMFAPEDEQGIPLVIFGLMIIICTLLVVFVESKRQYGDVSPGRSKDVISDDA